MHASGFGISEGAVFLIVRSTKDLEPRSLSVAWRCYQFKPECIYPSERTEPASARPDLGDRYPTLLEPQSEHCTFANIPKTFYYSRSVRRIHVLLLRTDSICLLGRSEQTQLSSYTACAWEKVMQRPASILGMRWSPIVYKGG